MSDVLEWVKVAVRWIHVFAVILWIGSTYLFNFFEKSLEREDGMPDNVRGHLWMVHGGGFYEATKFKRPEVMPRQLHWFKWEAATTWISGAVLIGLVYYYGGGGQPLLVEPEQNFTHGVIAGLLTIFGGWIVYDLLVRSPIGQKEMVFAAIGWCGLVGITYVLGRFIAPRAVYLHVGGMMGTIMAANVWMRILPSQSKQLAAIKEGKEIAATTFATGPLRSKQNSYMVVPLVFLMISNHYPTIHGSDYNWIIFGVLLLVGWGVARLFRGPTTAGEGAPVKAEVGYVHAAVALVLLIGLPLFGLRVGSAKATSTGSPSGTTKPPIRNTDKPAPLGDAVLKGTVTFEGDVPAAVPWGGAGSPECKPLHEETLTLVHVQHGKLAGAFVYIKDGLPDGSYEVPDTTVKLDQKGCEYSPRVFGIMAGQRLEIGNSDRLMHNVHSPEFNTPFPFGETRTLALEETGVMQLFKCDVHPWMRAYAGVVDHPFYAVSSDDGTFKIPKLTEGEYTVAAWHEKLGTIEQAATVSATSGNVVLAFK